MDIKITITMPDSDSDIKEILKQIVVLKNGYADDSKHIAVKNILAKIYAELKGAYVTN